MRILLFLALIGFSYAYVKSRKNVITDEFINEINSKQSLWTAGKNFNNRTFDDIRKLLGVVKKSKVGFTRQHYDVRDDIPESFDAREQWSSCDIIKEIPDQSACGSCWAVAAASSMSDRICIQTDGKTQVRVSAVNIMSCCDECGYGCEGGWPLEAWSYWQDPGIVSGGLYQSADGCQPYPFPTCEHHDTSGSYPACQADLYDTPDCSSSCDTSADYSASLTYGASAYYIEGEQDMQQDILANGPIVADFDVYADFVAYKSGIYKYTTGDYLGGHAVRVLGWGVDNGVKYWLISNSWNPDWGENGLFRMIRGESDCGIEDDCSAGLAKGCQPYPFPTCEHHDTSGSYPACQADLYDTPDCSSSCDTSADYSASLTYGASAYYIEGEQDMQQDILANGPIVADFDVYADFVAYKSGIYKYTTGDYLGGHAVRVLGWGVDNGVKYWLISNSWNPDWGENGLFRMIRGESDCGIEDDCSAGLAKV